MAQGKSSDLPYATILQKGSALIVPNTTLTTILTFTNTSDILWFEGFNGSGEIDAEYTLVINTILKMSLMSSEQNRYVQHFFGVPGMRIEIGDIIDIKVQHFNTVVTGDFHASLWGTRR